MRKLFLDLETTGLDPLTGQILEIAIIDETGRCLHSTRYNIDESLRLESDEEINAALEYNKLSREELALYLPLDKFSLLALEALLTCNEVIGHNISFDKSFLEASSNRILGYNCFQSVTWTCTMAMLAKSKSIKSGRVKLPNMKLNAIAHSALSDADNCRLLYQALQPKPPSAEWNW
jgi:DNA polymerase III epsilon subunit-like protein